MENISNVSYFSVWDVNIGINCYHRKECGIHIGTGNVDRELLKCLGEWMRYLYLILISLGLL